MCRYRTWWWWTIIIVAFTICFEPYVLAFAEYPGLGWVARTGMHLINLIAGDNESGLLCCLSSIKRAAVLTFCYVVCYSFAAMVVDTTSCYRLPAADSS